MATLIWIYLQWILCVFVMEYSCLKPSDNNRKEYCTLDTFEPVCPHGEVVVVQQATYGRMRVGRCLATDFYIGCAVDVLQIADSICSGRQQCSILVPNAEMMAAVNCLEDQSLLGSAYLEASSTCIKVFVPKQKSCFTSEGHLTVDTNVKYLSSLVSMETSCGLRDTPWQLTAMAGQQVQINILDFSWENESSVDNDVVSKRHCVKNYGYILDIESDDVFTICGGKEREKLLYTSTSPSVQVVLDQSAVEKYHFLLSYKAVGCPAYPAPSYTWQEKEENDTLTIGCVSSDKSWRLVCVNNMWIGIVGNCTQPSTPTMPSTKGYAVPQQAAVETGNSVMLPVVERNHVITFILGCTTLIICCTVVVLGIYCTKRYAVNTLRSPITSLPTLQTVKDGNRTLIYRTVDSSTLQKPDNPPTYSAALPKDERPPPPPKRRTSGPVKRNSDYLTPCNEEICGDESVHYYILENNVQPNEGEKVYQNIP